MELRRDTSNSATDFDKRHLPSSSKCDRNAKMIIEMRSECDQRIDRVRQENANKEETGNSVEKQTADKISSTFKNAIESSILRKHGAVMICQW